MEVIERICNKIFAEIEIEVNKCCAKFEEVFIEERALGQLVVNVLWNKSKSLLVNDLYRKMNLLKFIKSEII